MLRPSIAATAAVLILTSQAFADDRADCKAKGVTPQARLEACTRFIESSGPSLDVVYSYYNRGLAKRTLGDLAGAIADFSAVLPANDAARSSYDDTDRAVGDSGVNMALIARGETHEQTKDNAAALADYDAALTRSPQSVAALRKRAPLLTKLGRRADAIADYRTILASDFSSDAWKAEAEAALRALGAAP